MNLQIAQSIKQLKMAYVTVSKAHIELMDFVECVNLTNFIIQRTKYVNNAQKIVSDVQIKSCVENANHISDLSMDNVNSTSTISKKETLISLKTS